MISVLIEGKLHSDPVRRTSKNGSAFITARMLANGDDGETVWCSLIAFDAGAVEALGKLAAGDSLAAAGFASLSLWQSKDGEHRAGLKITANRILSVYSAGKRRGASSKNGGKA